MKEIQIYDVFTVSESKENPWAKIGTGFLNCDGSINVILEAYPVSGRLHIRARDSAEKSE
ncbi:MAG TPA: hypothetical protein DF383_13260 [Deltaproteobacteria bacterium]|nr:hypothetical protein [Deltaproteobacteria bacterium]